MDLGHQQSNDARQILEYLFNLQYLRPQEPVARALARASEQLGFCPNAAETAVHELQLDAAESIGRLRRAELEALSQSICSSWQDVPPPLPATYA